MPTTTPENASDLYKSQITDIAVPSPANKAAAVLLTPINGKQIFVNGSDGGWFTGVTGLTPGTLADDGGAACGTVFIPTGGDGSAGWERDYDGALFEEWFGVVADDSTDIIDQLQAAVDAGFKYKKEIQMLSGVHKTTKPLRVYGGSVALSPDYSTKLFGVTRESTVIKKYGSSDGGSGYSFESNSVVIVVDDGVYAGGDAVGNSKWVWMENITLEGNGSDVLYGIDFSSHGSDHKMFGIRILGVTHSGVYITGNHWMCRWDKLYVQGGVGGLQYGFNHVSGIGTSTIWTHPYVIGASVAAYNVNGTYQTMIGPAADSCTGIIYDLSSFKGTLVSPGAESPGAETQFLIGQFANVSIINSDTIGNYTSATATVIDVATGGKAEFHGGRLGYDPTETPLTLPGYLYKVANVGNLALYDTVDPAFTLDGIVAGALFSTQDSINRNGVNQRAGSATIAANATTTFTISITDSNFTGPVTFDFSGFTTAAAGSVMVKVMAGGFLGAATATNTSKIIDSGVNGSLTISALTKAVNGFSFDVINANLTAVGDLNWVATGGFSSVSVIAS